MIFDPLTNSPDITTNSSASLRLRLKRLPNPSLPPENFDISYQWDYTPFGEAYGFENRYRRNNMGHSHSSNSPQRDLIPYLYTGKYQTSLTGLIDMDARWYNPQVGRFIQPDYYNLAELALPKGARNKLLATTSLNTQMLLNDPSQQMRYGYVSGNPMRWVDPMGLEVFNMGRDLDVGLFSSLPGEHQFTTLKPNNQSDFTNPIIIEGVKFEYVDVGAGNKGFTLGAHKDGESDTLVFIPNQSADLMAACQFFEPEKYLTTGVANYSTEVFMVENSAEDTSLINTYLTAAANYYNNTQKFPEPYGDYVVKEGGAGNSNSWNQSLHEVVGSVTVEDMSGYDMFHSQRISLDLFRQSCLKPRGLV